MINEIIIFGFSGSGKSTLANLIAEKYNLRVIHPSGILRDLYEGKKIEIQETKYNKGFWESKKGIDLFKSRLKEEEPLDVVSDRILLHEIKKGNAVIDSWSLPWLTDIGLKIYLQADIDIRSKRVSRRSHIDYEKAKNIVFMKDSETTKLFKRLYNFDIEHDHGVFDYVVNTNNLTRKEVFKIVCKHIDYQSQNSLEINR